MNVHHGHHGLIQVHVYLILLLETDFGPEDVVVEIKPMIQVRAMTNKMLLNAHQEFVLIFSANALCTSV